MKVYVVEQGCRYEGGEVIDVFLNEKKAIAFAQKIFDEKKNEDWRKDLSFREIEEKKPFQKVPYKVNYVDGLSWIIDSDFISVTTFNVRNKSPEPKEAGVKK